MPTLPAISRSWRYRVNLDCTDTTDELHRATLALEIKNSIIGGGSGWTDGGGSTIAAPTSWAVVASSDGTTADDRDNWDDTGDLVWATAPTAHSWTVVRHENYFGTSDPLELLIDLTEASSTTRNGTMGVYLSRNGFDISSPVTTARPTAEDEIEVLVADGAMTTAAWQGSDTNDATHETGRLHFMMSSDGRAIRIIICRDGTCTAFWDLFRLDDWLTTSLTIPALMMIGSRDADTEVLTWANFQSQTYVQYVGRDDTIGGQYRGRLAIPVTTGSNTSVTAMAACNLGGVSSSNFSAIDIEVLTPAAGVATTLVDLWACRAANAGLHYPDDGSRTHAQVGILGTPWNGSQILLS